MPPCFGSAAYAALQIVVKANIATANAHALRMLSSPFVSALPRLALSRLALPRLALFRLGRLAATIAIGGGRSNRKAFGGIVNLDERLRPSRDKTRRPYPPLQALTTPSLDHSKP